MQKLYSHILGFFRINRIEFAIFVSILLMTICGLIVYSVHVGHYSQAISLLSPLIITAGVMVALDNLVTSEKNRHKDKDREESRFRFDICVSQLEKLSDALKPNSVPLGEGNSWVTNSGWNTQQLNKAKILIDSYTELKEGVLDEHLQALNVEESIYKNSFLSQASTHSGYDYFQLLYQGCSSAEIDERLYRHNERLMELAEEPDGKNFGYWDTTEFQKLPLSVSPDLLLQVVWFFLEGVEDYSLYNFNDIIKTLKKSGLHGIAEYLCWYKHIQRDRDGILKLSRGSP